MIPHCQSFISTVIIMDSLNSMPMLTSNENKFSESKHRYDNLIVCLLIWSAPGHWSQICFSTVSERLGNEELSNSKILEGTPEVLNVRT